MSLFELSFRVLLAFVVLLTLTKIMGRKELSQMTYFNYVSGITIGAIAGVLVIDSNISIRNGVFALVAWTSVTILLGFIDIGSKKARNMIEGEPKILIKKGQIMEKELRKVRLDIDALNALLRQKDVFAISEVDYAIFETDGNLSVLKKETKNDEVSQQKMSKDAPPIATAVISDGVIQEENLSKLNLDHAWVNQQLQQAGISKIEDVFYAEIQKDGSLYIDQRHDVIH